MATTAAAFSIWIDGKMAVSSQLKIPRDKKEKKEAWTGLTAGACH